MVIDTSALFAVLFDEPQRPQVEAIIREPTNRLHLAFVTLVEVEYRLIRRKMPQTVVDETMLTLRQWPMTVHEATYEWGRHAAQVKARYPMSLADAWIAALALTIDATLVHKDAEFDSVPALRVVRV